MPTPPSVADLAAFLRDPRGLVGRAAAGSGDVAELRVGRRTLLVKRPADAAHVLAWNHAGYEKTPRLTRGRGRRAAGDGMFTAPSSAALAHRRPVQPLFGRRALEGLRPAIERCVEDLVRGWRAGAEVDLDQEAARLAHRAATATVLGHGASGALHDAIELRRRRLFGALGAPIPLPAWAPLALTPRDRATLRGGDRALAELVADRRADPRADLVSALAASGLDDARVRDEALSLALAGQEAVTRAMAAAIAAIGSHPDAVAAVRAEAAAEGDGRSAFTERAVLEALRLHPPTTFIVRVAQRADRLPSGVAVARGTKVLVAPYVLHNDPSLFPDPARFDPDRFTPEARRARERYAYIPFGAGPRTCIARNLALLQTGIVVEGVLRRFDLDPRETGGRRVRLSAAGAPSPDSYTRSA